MGGALLSRILTTDFFSQKFDITVLVRSTEKARRLEIEYNVKACVGSLDNTDTIEQLAQQSHVVWSMVREYAQYRQLILLDGVQANSDHLEATHAILRGLKKRHEELKDQPVVMHTVSVDIQGGTESSL